MDFSILFKLNLIMSNTKICFQLSKKSDFSLFYNKTQFEKKFPINFQCLQRDEKSICGSNEIFSKYQDWF